MSLLPGEHGRRHQGGRSGRRDGSHRPVGADCPAPGVGAKHFSPLPYATDNEEKQKIKQ
ncbi:hypothetical protein DESC_610382 [Desulfosarcina cetonica]|nr:hypothetical protein DESC_610382 [Desulfosarcina cetonica]